jgi:hypothetical protein
MAKIINVRPLPNWQLEIEFDDGTAGTISLADRLFGPMFEPLRDPEFFSQVQLDGFESICWPNGADLAPDAIHRRLVAENQIAARS